MFEVKDVVTGKILDKDDVIDRVFFISELYLGHFGDLLAIYEDENEYGELESNVHEVSDRYEVVKRSE